MAPWTGLSGFKPSTMAWHANCGAVKLIRAVQQPGYGLVPAFGQTTVKVCGGMELWCWIVIWTLGYQRHKGNGSNQGWQLTVGL